VSDRVRQLCAHLRVEKNNPFEALCIMINRIEGLRTFGVQLASFSFPRPIYLFPLLLAPFTNYFCYLLPCFLLCARVTQQLLVADPKLCKEGCAGNNSIQTSPFEIYIYEFNNFLLKFLR